MNVLDKKLILNGIRWEEKDWEFGISRCKLSHRMENNKVLLGVSLGAHWVDSRESSLLRRLERGREIGR